METIKYYLGYRVESHGHLGIMEQKMEPKMHYLERFGLSNPRLVGMTMPPEPAHIPPKGA